MSNLVVVNLTQRLSSIDRFLSIREEVQALKAKKSLLLFNKYDKYSKYSIKNISRYTGIKKNISVIPYNTLYFEAAGEGSVADLFLKIRTTDPMDTNGLFVQQVKDGVEQIIYKIQELQMRT